MNQTIYLRIMIPDKSWLVDMKFLKFIFQYVLILCIVTSYFTSHFTVCRIFYMWIYVFDYLFLIAV